VWKVKIGRAFQMTRRDQSMVTSRPQADTKKKEGKETGVKWTYKRMIYMASGFFWMASFTVDMHRKMASSSN